MFRLAAAQVYAPFFASAPADLTLNFDASDTAAIRTYSYLLLPDISFDPSLSLSDVNVTVGGLHGDFMLFDSIKNKFSFVGITMNCVGTFPIKVTLASLQYPELSNAYFFDITVHDATTYTTENDPSLVVELMQWSEPTVTYNNAHQEYHEGYVAR